MSIFSTSESPGVTFREIDLSGVVRNAQSTTGALVGNFRWGPVLERVAVADEAELVSDFGAPDNVTTVDFHSASMFLKYSQDLLVVRNIDSDARNSYSSAEGASAPSVRNLDHFSSQEDALDSAGHTFIGRYPGDLGNALKVEVCPVDSADTAFDGWTYKGQFDAAPGTSAFAEAKGASNDEAHVVVVDRTGEFTGTPGTILETFPFLSLAANAKNTDGSSNFIKDVVNARSKFVYFAGFDSDYTAANAGNDASSGVDFALAAPAVKSVSLSGGVASAALSIGQFETGYDLFADVDTVQVDFLIAPAMTSGSDLISVVNDLVTTAQSLRKDCIVVASPNKAAVVNNTDPVTATTVVTNQFTASSYLVVDNNWLKVYDKYNDKYVWVPAAPSTAGIIAASDLNSAPWFSPAGTRRGQYLGVTSLAYSPTKAERDTLYKAGVNPVANIPGYGVLLYGDKTKLGRPSAFDRINVRRLFLVLERTISDAAKNVIFEFNDEFTRAEFVNVVEPVLREIKGRRGITDFRVVSDETNNTAAVIDRNEFRADIFVAPARSINFVTLSFVATRTGVDFNEVVGTV